VTTSSFISAMADGENEIASMIDVDLGAADTDFVNVQLFDMNTGTVDLSQGDQTNYSTCTHCFLVYEDFIDGTGPTTIYFQTEGSFTIDSFGATLDAVAGSFSGVKLVEVTIDDSNMFESTPVPGGGCIEVADGSFDTTI